MSIKDRALLVKLSRSAFNRKIKDNDETAKVNQANNTVDGATVYKDLFKYSAEINAINSKSTEIYNYHKKYTLPWMDGGARLLPSTFYDNYIDTIGKKKSELETLLKDVESKYDSLVEADKTRLATLGKAQDYPSYDNFCRSYAVNVTLFPVADSSDFRVKVSDEAKQQLEKYIQEQEEQAYGEITKRVDTYLQRVIDVCTKDNARVHESLLEAGHDLADTLRILNVYKSKRIEEVSDKVKQLVESTTTHLLRTSQTSKDELADEARKIRDFINAPETMEVNGWHESVNAQEHTSKEDIM